MMKSESDYGGRRIVIIKGKYKGKKGFVSSTQFGINVDLDYKPLRIRVDADEICIITNKGDMDIIRK